MKYALFCILSVLLLLSCDPVRRLHNDARRRAAVSAYLIEQGICSGDTIYNYLRDTIITHDTTDYLLIYTDTSYVHDTAYITRQQVQSITKTIHHRDTLRITVNNTEALRVLRDKYENIVEQKNKQNNRQQTLSKIISVMGIALLLALAVIIKKI